MLGWAEFTDDPAKRGEEMWRGKRCKEGRKMWREGRGSEKWKKARKCKTARGGA